MNEQDWRACNDPQAMLTFLQDSGKLSERKARLFAVACARRVLPASPDEDMLQALAVAEQFADGTVTRHQLARARSSLKDHHSARVSRWSPLYSTHIRSVPAWHATREAIVRAAGEGARCCAWSSTRKVHFGKFVGMEYPQDELAAQAALLRDIFGNPFRTPPVVEPAWLAWNDGTVRQLAESIYDERAFDRLPLLADALEEAGCDNAAMLAHCRGPGPHVRGCWVVDLLTGRS
jgi:hypothetical protein